MGYIDRDGFKEWLKDNYTSNDKIVTDTISRADRVRRAFEEIDSDFSYEREIEQDNGQAFWNLISRRGTTIHEKINLPIGTNQMDSISSSAKKYIKYLREKTNS